MARKIDQLETSSVEWMTLHFCDSKEFADRIINDLNKDFGYKRADVLEYFRSFGLYYSKLPRTGVDIRDEEE